MRKEAGFEVVDHIIVGYKADGSAKEIFKSKSFLSDVLADDIVNTLDGYTKECNINGENVTISVKKV